MAHHDMKIFIQVSADYMRNNTEKSGSDLKTYLQNIASATDLSVFNPDSIVAPYFYVSLHELLRSLDLQSPLVWSTISALQKACANKHARASLIHVFKFIPVLSRFLSVSDLQHKILQILQELTYGVKVTWQEAHLPQLIMTLTQIIMGKNKAYKTQALNVLVNLCYKNPPVLYVLMRKVEIKNFIKCVTKMNDNASVRMLACKMLIVLSELKGPLPDADILNFVDVSFNCIADAFQHQDLITIQQMADFFTDMVNNTQFQRVMEKYPKTVEDTKRLIELLDTTVEGSGRIDECVAALITFIDTAFKMKISKTIKLSPRLLTSIIPWIDNEKTCPSALNIILSITRSCCEEIDIGSSEILQTYAVIVPNIIKILSCSCDHGLSEENKERLATALNLLANMSLASNNLSNMIIQVLTCEGVKNIFEELYKQNYFLEKSLINNIGTNLSMHLLFLIGALSQFSSDWMELHSELLNTPQILLSLAVTIMYDEKDMKYKVLKLFSSNSWRDDSLAALSAIMVQLKPDIKMDKEEPKPLGFPETTPILVSESRIEELLDNLERSNVNEPSTSEIMELYEYKLAAMVHSERRLQTALEASDTHCSSLNHQLAQLKNEDARLHQMLFYVQQTVEGAYAEKNDLINQISKLTSESSLEKTMNAKKIKQLTKRCQEMEEAFKEREVKLQEEMSKNEHLSLVLEAKSVECDEITSKVQECRSKYEDLISLKALTEQSLEKAKSQIAEYEMQLADFKSENDDLKSSLAETREENSEKDEKLAEFTKQIQYLEHIREAVISVAAKKGNF